MAYLTPPTTLTCLACGFEGQIVVVVGVGPGSRKGDIPQRYFKDPGVFTKGKTEDGIGTLSCPEDGTLLWTNKPGAPAYGPLTEEDMRGLTGRRWRVTAQGRYNRLGSIQAHDPRGPLLRGDYHG